MINCCYVIYNFCNFSASDKESSVRVVNNGRRKPFFFLDLVLVPTLFFFFLFSWDLLNCDGPCQQWGWGYSQLHRRRGVKVTFAGEYGWKEVELVNDEMLLFSGDFFRREFASLSSNFFGENFWNIILKLMARIIKARWHIGKLFCI